MAASILISAPRVRTHSNPVTDDGCEAKCSHEIGGVFVVSGGDAAEVLEASEHALDCVAVPVAGFIKIMELLAVGLVGNDGLDAAAYEPSTPMIGIVGLVGEQVAGVGEAISQHHGARDVGDLAGREIEGEGSAAVVAQGVDLGVAPALGAADGLNRSPPFPPPAQRCTLTWVVSMEICSGFPALAAVNAANRYCQ